ncbi:serine protease [Mesorhizobium sp. GbtcB19]|uniref:trypsin-like serine peptidase n=1 Tax=Mesorhizobium sp. GbtcB19 TaxID=2824764 RepID=UPI001C2F29FE|nr:trypsin-like peptidase domain-containing protein [Mesorhizobium sp. GbtcB19]
MPNDAQLRAQRRSWTCALEDFAGVNGTGVLIAPDLVLTNFHVIQKLQKSLQDNPRRLADARIHFDYFQQGAGESFGLAATDWLPAFSPFAKRDLNIQEPPAPDKLDYAVIRLARRIGEEPLPAGNAAGWPDGTKPAKRGWLILPAPETRPTTGANIVLYHHPCGFVENQFQSLPMGETRGRVTEVDVGWLRVAHDANTQHGSSGAICYGDNLEPIALHHAGDPESALGEQFPNQRPLPPGQRAIPLGAIVAQLCHSPIYQSMLPAKDPPIRTIFDPTQEAIKLELLKTRHKRAMALLDRDDPQWDILDSINTANSVVHAIACRSVDGLEFFMRRLREASLGLKQLPRPELQERISRFLNEGLSENGWGDGSASVDTRLTPVDAAAKIVRKIESEIRQDQGTVFAIGQTFARFDFERERQLITEVARCCTPLLGTGQAKFQVFFIYQDNAPTPRKWAAERASVAELWASPPPKGSNLGQCLNFDDMSRDQMKGWISAINNAFQINSEDLCNRMDDIFADQKIPFAALEPKLRDITKVFCEITRK